jgi:HYR domain
MSRALLLFAAALGSLAIGGARADADSVGTYQLKGTFKNSFLGIPCPAGSTATNCYRNASVDGAVIPGLGKVSTKYTLLLDFAGSCGNVHAQIPIVIAGKGEIDFATKSTGCVAPDQLMKYPPSDVTVTGGNGLYAGASGSGVLNYENHERGAGSGSSFLTWTGTLNVPGLAFDTTAPRIAGAISRTARTRAAAGTRVRYAVSATDATDGKVLPSCKPKSGSVFRVGRTTVTCTAVDGSANTATKRFVITVKRVRQ